MEQRFRNMESWTRDHRTVAIAGIPGMAPRLYGGTMAAGRHDGTTSLRHRGRHSARQHGGTVARRHRSRHGGTAARRHSDTTARWHRDGGTATLHSGTAAWRHDCMTRAARRHDPGGTAAQQHVHYGRSRVHYEAWLSDSVSVRLTRSLGTRAAHARRTPAKPPCCSSGSFGFAKLFEEPHF